MANMANVIHMEPFAAEANNPAEAWAEWRRSFELFETAVKYNKEDDETRTAFLLSIIGKSSLKEYLTFTFPALAAGQTRTVKEVLDKFDEHYKPYRNVTLATFVFNNIVQKQSQNFDSFVTEVKLQGDQCEFGAAYDRNVKDRIIQGLREDVLRERLLREGMLTLQKTIEICKSAELSKLHSIAMTQSSTSMQIDAINYNKGKREQNNYPAKHHSQNNYSAKHHSQNNYPAKHHNQNNYSIKQEYQSNYQPKHQNSYSNQHSSNKQSQRPCSRCGSRHLPRQCPAYGKPCNNCAMQNHFAIVCRQPKQTANKHRQVSTIESIESNIAYIGSLTTGNNFDFIQQIIVNNHPINFKLDTGAQVNVLSTSILNDLCDSPLLKSSTISVCTYSGESLPVVGECMLKCVVNDKCRLLKFIIVNLDVQPVLGASACVELHLIQRINGVDIQSSNPSEVIEEFKDVFEGIGRLPGKHRIMLHDNATPVIAASRKVPLALEQKVQDELARMIQDGIIEKVTKPTDWVNPVVIVPKKDNTIRICLDPRHLNKFIRRQHYQIPSQDQLLSKLKGSRIFSLVDAKNAFYHIQLDDESADLCTFITPFGRYRFLVMPFGLSCAPEVFQMAMDTLFENYPEINPYFDDIILHSETMNDHCKQLRTVLQIARQNGLKLNKNKVQLAVPKLQYLGHIVSVAGLSPDPKKVQAISDYPTPQNKQELMRFLGMATYLMKFVPQFSQETSVLRSLLKQDTHWIWDATLEKAFLRVKQLLQTKPVLQFFDRNQPVLLSVDASSFGLGGVLLQSNKPVAYTSATLLDAQTRYSQIEKELLAVVHACEHFHYYVFGKEILIQTDHKPLLGLIHKPFDAISPRLQRLLLRLQRYSFKLTHVPGKELVIADALSRAPLPEDPVSTTDIDQVHLMVSVIVHASQSRLDDIRKATESDPELKAVQQYILNGWPQKRHSVDVQARSFLNCQSELYIEDGFICRGQRLVIPKSCRKDILQYLHVGHRGIVTCKNLARQSLYWPGLSTEIENMVSNCAICQQNQKQNTKEPLLDRKLADRPWQKVAIDFFHLSSVTYIMIIDYYSKYIEIQHLHQTTAPSVINALKASFARFGIPEEIVSDNGPPFDSTTFTQFCKEWDIFFNPSSPGFPRSNGQVERCIQTVKSSLTKAVQDQNDVHLVLMEYRNAPMDGMPSPAEILMGRRIRTIVPTLPSQLNPHYDCKQVKERLEYRQQRQHKYDHSSKSLTPLQLNQQVLFRHQNKWWRGEITTVGPQPRSYIITAENGRQYRRNRFHIKPFKSTQTVMPKSTVEDLFTTQSSVHPNQQSSVVPQTSPASQGHSSNEPAKNVTRCGRTIKPPQRFTE